MTKPKKWDSMTLEEQEEWHAKRRAYNSKWRKENLDKININYKRWCEKNPERKKTKDKAYYKNNRDRLLKYAREYARKNPGRRNFINKKWRKANPEKAKAIYKRYKQSHSEQYKIAQRKHDSRLREKLSDVYISQRLRIPVRFLREQTPELIEAKRSSLMLKRAIQNLKSK